MSTELVGPLPEIRFHDGTRVAYTPPRDTCDPRYAACAEHRPACDCREAHLAEDIADARATLKQIDTAAAQILAGHPTRVLGASHLCCECTGCQIARAGHIFLPGNFFEASA